MEPVPVGQGDPGRVDSRGDLDEEPLQPVLEPQLRRQVRRAAVEVLAVLVLHDGPDGLLAVCLAQVGRLKDDLEVLVHRRAVLGRLVRPVVVEDEHRAAQVPGLLFEVVDEAAELLGVRRVRREEDGQRQRLAYGTEHRHVLEHLQVATDDHRLPSHPRPAGLRRRLEGRLVRVDDRAAVVFERFHLLGELYPLRYERQHLLVGQPLPDLRLAEADLVLLVDAFQLVDRYRDAELAAVPPGALVDGQVEQVAQQLLADETLLDVARYQTRAAHPASHLTVAVAVPVKLLDDLVDGRRGDAVVPADLAVGLDDPAEVGRRPVPLRDQEEHLLLRQGPSP